MFQLIAIRPFENCRRHIKKCLKSDSFYYFCDLFVIRQDGSIIRNQDGKDIDSTFFKVNGGDTNIMLSAIVGKNGDGKSTIVELMMRLINNYTCNVEGLMTDVNPTIKVEGIAAEFYYLLDNAIYRLFDREGHGEVKLEKIATLGEQGNLIMLVEPEAVDNHNQLANQFFYTMVSNYSHYAYNIFDFKKEWSRVEEMGNNDNERCWLYYIFHKNDGYRTPLVLNPYRNQGNIDINNEAYLNRQRLISLFVDADEPQANRPTFRCLYGKTARYATIEDSEESKLQQKTIIDFFTACKKDELLVKEINKTLETNENIVEHGNIIEECLQLLRYIHANWIHGNEQLLQVIMEWDEMEKNRYNPLNEDRGFLTDRSDIKRWLEALTSVDFGNGSEQEKVYYVDAIRPYSHFNLAQLQRLGLIKYICYLLGGHAEEFYPGIDRFDLTMDEIACPYEQLTRDKKCQHYIVYKIISIFETYLEDYKRPCRMYDGAVIRENTIPNAYVANAVVKLWDDMRYRPSHINLKLRQALFYRQHYLREDRDVFRERMTLDELKDVIENTQELEQLPPPFLTVDIVFVSNTNHLEEISMETLSSGERQRLASLSGVVYHLRNIDSIDEERIQYHHINIVLEEIELYFHPECQRAFIKELIEAIEHIGLQSIKNVNILFVTHSPFILSDIPKTNVLLLEKGVPASEEKKRQLTTFGANIYDMLKTGFFLDGPVGAFAEYVIKNVVKSIRAEHAPELSIEDIKKRIELIDEPIMKQLLIEEYTRKYDKELKRLYLEEELRKLERGENHVEA